MVDIGKQLPVELRNKSAVGSAEVHRDLATQHHPVAGPSGTSFRTTNASSSTSAAVTEQDYADFAASGRQAVPPSGDVDKADGLGGAEKESRAAKIAASSYTPQDLESRAADRNDVMKLLASKNSLDDLDDALEHLSARQSQSWREKADNMTPSDPTYSTASFTSQDHPYIFSLLHLPDGEAIQSYLASNTYSNDVWGLPETLKEDLDRLQSTNEDSSSKQQALRRLMMLKSHIGFDGSKHSSGKAVERNEGRVKFDYTDWAKIWQS